MQQKALAIILNTLPNGIDQHEQIGSILVSLFLENMEIAISLLS